MGGVLVADLLSCGATECAPQAIHSRDAGLHSRSVRLLVSVNDPECCVSVSGDRWSVGELLLGLLKETAGSLTRKPAAVTDEAGSSPVEQSKELQQCMTHADSQTSSFGGWQ
jgi:hypothetical protein